MGFWEYQYDAKIEELDGIRGQPADTLIHVEKGRSWDEYGDDCLYYEETQALAVWNSMEEGTEQSDWCVLPASHWVSWGLYQPTRSSIIDFSGVNGHADIQTSRNIGSNEIIYEGLEDSGPIQISETIQFTIEDLGVAKVPTDVGCNFRTTVRNAGEHSQTLILTDDAGSTIWRNIGTTCDSETIYLDSGRSYSISFTTNSVSVNESVTMISDFAAVAYQPLLLSDDGTALIRSEVSLSSEELASMSVTNPTFQKNPKSLDAKLIYSMFIPCLGVGALVFMLMRSMARGYEWEMNKCYGCDLCDDACPVRLFNAGDKLNIIYNTWNNEDDGVPLYSCLTCTACTNACPQLVDYDSYIDIRRSMVVGGPPASEIPHTVLQAVLAAEAEEDADESFIPVKDYPLTPA